MQPQNHLYKLQEAYNNLLLLFSHPHDSSSAQIPSPPSSPKLEEAGADPTQNPLVRTCTLLPSYCDNNLPCLQTSTQTLPSDYKAENVVVGIDSSYEVIPSELSTTANSEQALLVRDHVIHTLVTLNTIKLFCLCFLQSSPPPVHVYTHPKQAASHPIQETTTNTNTADSAQALLV